MKKWKPVLAAVVTVAAVWLVLDRTRLGPWLAKRWNDLDNTQGFVIGALVALVGVLVNNLALARLEKSRHDRTMEIEEARHQRAVEVETARHERATEVADVGWQRETAKGWDATRRDLYGDLLARAQGASTVRRITDKDARRIRQTELSEQIGSILGRIRLMSDDDVTIQAAREFGVTALRFSRNPTDERRDMFLAARNTFVRHARTELGRKTLPDLPPIEIIPTDIEADQTAPDAAP